MFLSQIQPCRNLPYLKRDCDDTYHGMLKLCPLRSKPALLKKGLRLSTTCQSNRMADVVSKPALLKKGLRHLPQPLRQRGTGGCRNLPYLKRDCDRMQSKFLPSVFFKSKPALLKKGLRHLFVFKLIISTICHVETCPT